MTLEQLTEFFKIMTLINIGIFLVSAVLTMALKNLVGNMHGKLFGLKGDSVAAINYGFLGMYKIFILVFNIVPYIALLMLK